MRRMTGSRISGSRRGGERGAITVVFASMLSLVFMGMLALSVDVGSMLYERRQLQNAADASAMALASGCAQDDALCDPTSDELDLDPLLNANAADETAQFDPDRAFAPDGACGRNAADLPDCPSSDPDVAPGIDEIRECPPLPDWLAGDGDEISYVETYTRTETDADSTLLPRYFSRALTGEDGPSIRSCARAAWGPPGPHGGSVPIVISACEWNDQTSGGTDYVSEQPVGASPGYGGSGQPAWPGIDREVEVILHDPQDEDSSCDWNGKDTAGGFGFVDEDDCLADVTEDGWVPIKTGASVPNGCGDFVDSVAGTVISIPVFDCLLAIKNTEPDPSGPAPTTPAGVCDPTKPEMAGNNGWYHVQGWALFYVSGYSLPGHTQSSVMPGGMATCSTPGAKCLYGWFLKGELDGAPPVIDPDPDGDFGTYVVVPAG